VKRVFGYLALASVISLLALAPLSVAQASKVVICHIPPGNPANAHDIEVSTNAVPAHLAHGDTLGACGAPPPPPPPPCNLPDDCPPTV
jgi:hypothetical protein